jgi:hypothetical protein
MKAGFVVDKRGHKVAVVLTVKKYKKLLADQEELKYIRRFDKARSTVEASVPVKKARTKRLAKQKKK